ncbi:hypothetical protein E4T66_04825 [Sinimarinibacterium sp. CAU 1509]|uniref:GDYXXLXY domain-containing protein n=1 Tax=Sinimarinibacterium sp. CAU 1509 TaxID=2562283 RepID=UPI0010AD45C0|nr:GDYXXLXY domain-containing protein [Sinimarinibacterium sp. CAU 1509]TJY63039.1 hypothetical protein E4T66_04825 [Sinimarinibacterium sp. CAU 1509]
MTARWMWGALALVFALHWTVPAALIQRGTATLERGTQYRFRTAPVDPVDPFRGRYVALDFDAARIAVNAQAEYAEGETLYAAITVGDDGFAHLLPPQHGLPKTGDALKVTVLWNNEGELGVALPFDRYYLDEALAPEAEQIYRERNRRVNPDEADDADPRRPAYVTVRVLDGYAVLEQLYIDGMPVRALIDSQP